MAGKIERASSPKAARIKAFGTKAGKSLAFSSLEVLKTVTPNMTSATYAAMDASRDITSFASRTSNQISRQMRILDRTKSGRNAKSIFDSAMADIKSGDFSLDKASTDAFNDYNDIFDNDPTYDDDGNPSNVGDPQIAGLGRAITTGNAASIDSIRESTRVIATTQIKSAKMMSEKSANITLFGINKLNTSMAGISNQLNVINSNLVSLINFQNANVSVANQAMLQYFDRSLEAFDKISKSYTMGRTDRKYRDNFIDNGFDLSGYKKHVKNNFDNTTLGSIVGMAKMAHNMASMTGEKPSASKLALEKIIIPALMGGNLTKGLEHFDSNFGKYAKAGLYKLGDMGRDYSKGGAKGSITRFIGQLLGLERPSVGTVKMGDFYKDSMAWNGEAQKTLVEVIPSYLSKMEASLAYMSGIDDRKIASKQRFYDMESGKFKGRSTLEKEYRDDRSTEILSATNDAMQKMNEYLAQNSTDQNQVKQLQKIMSDAIQDRIYNGSGFNGSYKSAIKNVNTNLSREQGKDLTLMMEDAIEKAIDNLSEHNRTIQSESSGSKYRYLFNDERTSYNQNPRENLFTKSWGFSYGSIKDEILDTLAANNMDPSLFEFSGSFMGEYQKAKNRDVSDSQLQKMVAAEWNRRNNKSKFQNARRRSGAGGWHGRFDSVVNRGLDWVDDREYDAIFGGDATRASSRMSGTTGGLNAVGTSASSRMTNSTSLGSPNRMVESNIKRNANMTFRDIDNMTLEDANNTLALNAAGMLNVSKSVPTSAIGLIRSNQNALAATNEMAVKGAGLMDALRQTVVTMHTGAVGILGGIFGKDGFFKTALTSDWMKDNIAKLKTYLFDENSGLFSPIVKQFLDVGDYMKYVFNGKAYTDRKGVSHADTDNAVFKYLNKGYQFIFGNTMQFLFGDDYENNEIFQKYFSWLGGKKKRSGSAQQSKSSTGSTQVSSNINRSTQKLLGDTKTNSELLALPEHRPGNTGTLQSTALVVVPTVDSDGNVGEEKYDANDTESIHSTIEQNYVNGASSALANIDNGSKALSTVLMGDNKTPEEAEKSFLERFKDNLPKMLTAGIVGAGVSLASGGHMGPILGMFLPGGIVGGAIVGMGLQLLSNSKTFNKLVFGDIDEKTGEKTGGIISSHMQKNFKKALPTMVGGAVIGLINHGGLIAKLPGVGVLTSALLPGGVLGGAIMGMGVSLLSNSNTFKTILFGKENENGERTGGLSKAWSGARNIMTKAVPYIGAGLKGAGIGAVSGLVLKNMGVLGSAMSLGGPIGMGLMGLGIGIASQTDRFKKFLFGDEELDENGKPTGNRLKNGLFSKIQALLITNVFQPIKDSLKRNVEEFSYWVKLKLVDPFLQIFQPIVDQIKDIGGYIKEKVDKLADGIKVMIGGFFKKLFSPFVSLLGKVASGVLTGLRKSVQLAMSPITGALGLIKLALAPGREARDLKFKYRYFKGEYGDTNRTFLQRLGDITNMNRDSGLEEEDVLDENGNPTGEKRKVGTYFDAHREFAAEMRGKRKRVNDWDLITDHKKSIADRNDARKQNSQLSNITNYAKKKNKEWGSNKSVILSEAEVARMRKELLSKRYGNLNAAGLQTGDQIKELFYNRDDWMDKYGPNAKEAANLNVAGTTFEKKTAVHQTNVDEKLYTISNLLSQYFFGVKAYSSSGKAKKADFTVKESRNTNKEAQFNLDDMNFARIQTVGHGIQNSDKLKDMYRRMSARQGKNLSPNEFLTMVVGSDYADKIRDASDTTNVVSHEKPEADEKIQSNINQQGSAEKTNKLLSILARISSNGKLTTKHINDALSGKDISDKEANEYGSSSEEIGTNVTTGIGGFFTNLLNKKKKTDEKQARLLAERSESEDATSGTTSLALYNPNVLATKEQLSSSGNKNSKTRSEIFSTIFGKAFGLFGSILGSTLSLFGGSNILSTLKFLGIATLLGVAFKDAFKSIIDAVGGFMAKNTPHVYKFLTDTVGPIFTSTIPNFFKVTIPKFWNEKAAPFIQNELPSIISTGITNVATFVANNAELIVNSIASVLTAVVPVVGDALVKVVDSIWDWAHDKITNNDSNATKYSTAEEASTALLPGQRTVSTVDSDGNQVWVNIDKGQSVDSKGNVKNNAKTRYSATTATAVVTGRATASVLTTTANETAKRGAINASKATMGKSVASIAYDVKSSGIYKLIQKVATSIGSVLKNTKLAKILAKVEKFNECVIKAFGQLCEKALSALGKSSVPEIERLSAKAAQSLAKIGESVVGYIPFINVLWYGYFIIDGAVHPERLFNVSTDAIDYKMRLISALLGGLAATTSGAIINLGLSLIQDLLGIDIGCMLATIIYNLLAGDADEQLLKDAQAELNEEAKLYNADNPNSNITTSQYSEKKYKSGAESVWNSILNIFGKGDTTNYSKYEEQATSIVGSSWKRSSNTTAKTYSVKAFGGSSYGIGDGSYYGFSQGDPRWANAKIGTLPDGRPSTMAIGGCGPTALSEAASMVGYGPADMSPIGIARFAKNNGYIEQGGSSSKLFTEGASRLGMRSTKIGADGIINSINRGNPVIITGRSNSGFGPGLGSPFTPAGHVVTASGYDSHGNILINDPMSGRKRAYSKEQVASGMTNAWSIGRSNGRHNYYGNYNGGVVGYGVVGETRRSTSTSTILNAKYHLYGSKYIAENGDIAYGGKIPFTTFEELTITKWGGLGKKGSSSYNQFAISPQQNDKLLIDKALTKKYNGGTLITAAYQSIMNYMRDKKKGAIKLGMLSNFYYHGSSKQYSKYRISFYVYATTMMQLGAVQFTVTKLSRTNTNVKQNAATNLSSSIDEFGITKWGRLGKAGATSINPFGLDSIQMKSVISESSVRSAASHGYITSSAGTYLCTYQMHNIAVYSGARQRGITVLEFTNLWKSGKISLDNYAGLLKFVGDIDGTNIGGTSTPTTSSSIDGAAISGENTEDTANAPQGILNRLGYLVKAVGFVGNRIINGFGSSYQRIYDDNGNVVDQSAVDEFSRLLSGADGETSSSSDISGYNFTNAYNGVAGSNAHSTTKPSFSSNDNASFVKKILRGTMGTYDQYSVLPSLTLAQAIGESRWGKKSIGNNIFGIKAGNGWTGSRKRANTTEYVNGAYVPTVADFRDYASIDDSIVDHAKILVNDSRYAKVFKAQDYIAATKAVADAGYATTPTYASFLNSIIEGSHLDYFDNRDNKSNIKNDYGISWGLGPYYGITSASEATTAVNNLKKKTSAVGDYFANKWGIGKLSLDSSNSSSTTTQSTAIGGAGSGTQRGIVTAFRSWLSNPNGGAGTDGPLQYTADGTAPDGWTSGSGRNYTIKNTGKGCCSTGAAAAYRVALGSKAPDSVFNAGRHYMCNNFVNAPDFVTVDSSDIGSTLTKSGSVASGKTGRTPNAAVLQPGDLLFYRRSGGTIGHVEIYSGQNTRIGLGSSNGPHERALSTDAANFAVARRYNGFTSSYGPGSYYGIGGAAIASPINLIARNSTPIDYSSDSKYYGSIDDSSTTSKSIMEEKISQKLNLAVSSPDTSTKLDSIIGIMKDWFEYDKANEKKNSTVIANNGNTTNTGNNRTASNQNDRLMEIHSKISGSKAN